MGKSEMIHLAKQQYIADETVKLLVKIGINNLTMDNIAGAAEYTKRTLYTYFKSKDEILLWVFTDDLERRWKYQQESLKTADTGLDKLIVWANSLYTYCCEQEHALQLQSYMDYNFVDEEKVATEIFERFKSINNQLADGLRKIFEEGITDGSIRHDVEIDITINQFLFSYRAILKRAFADVYSFARFDHKKYVEHFLSLFIRSIQ